MSLKHRKPEFPWCVFNFEKQCVECTRCGQTYPIHMPCPVDLFVSIGNTFAKLHKYCKEGDAAK